MMRGLSMTLNYKRDTLLAKVKVNRDLHEKEFREALVAYRKSLVDLLASKLADAKEGKKVDHFIHLQVPSHYLKEYDRAICMLTETTQTDIPLEQQTYAQLVLDEWSWKNNFESNTKSYLSPTTYSAPGVYMSNTNPHGSVLDDISAFGND